MTKKIILSLFILGLINIPSLAKEPLQTIKLDDNTIDLNLEDLSKELRKTQEKTVLEFDEDTNPLPEIKKVVEQKIQEVEKVEEELVEQLEQKSEELEKAQEVLEEQVEEKLEEISNVVEEKNEEVSDSLKNTQENVQQKIEENIDDMQDVTDPNPDEFTDAIEAIEEAEKHVKQKVEDVEKAKEIVEAKVEQKAEELEEVKEAVEEKIEQKTEEVKVIKEEIKEETKEIIEEKPAVSDVSKLRPIAPVIDLSSTKTVTETAEDLADTDAIKLLSPNNASSKVSSVVAPIDAPKWEDFCEAGYENASTKDKENLLNIINFVNAERIKSNYWAERRAAFEKSINHCNSLEESGRSYCYEGVRRSEKEKNEM